MSNPTADCLTIAKGGFYNRIHVYLSNPLPCVLIAMWVIVTYWLPLSAIILL